MPRFAYVNGAYVPHGRAAVHVEDRGYQFADGVYEVVYLWRGRLVDEGPHLDRLDRSLRELRIDWPMSRAAMSMVMRELIRRNRVSTGLLYIQVTRGVAPRDHKFPRDTRPSLVMTLRAVPDAPQHMIEHGVQVVTLPDIRWARRDIKSVSLLPNVLGKQAAAEAGAYEAWQIDGDGNVTEGTSSNAWIVTAEGVLVTRPLGNEILSGITRRAILEQVAELGIPFEERAFSLEEALAAREAFVSSASHFVLPVTQIDRQVIANGAPGLVTTRLHARYLSFMQAEPPAIPAQIPQNRSKV